ncbi:MAG TPA: sulfatase-like hydrolase/transferase [Thermoanaerobaculia bacterium]|jgi:tetratricopeptide (TPR) repeat protein
MTRCRAALAALLCLLACARREPARATHGDAPVIVISIDTLRADHLPAYGYRGVATPGIDALRRDAILFENAYSHIPLTLPSHVSILTGELPPQHGVRNNIGYRFDAPRHETIASLLRKRGYAAGAAVSAYVLRGGTGLRDAFDFYDDAVEAKPDQPQADVRRAGGVTEAAAERWIEGRGQRPFFFLLHLYEPHAPYASYDVQIAAADAIVGRFLDFLKKKGIYERAIVILLSDHGEGLNDHGEAEHGIFLYREALHVPLLLKLPRSERAGQTVHKPAALIDVFPTIAALTGTSTPARNGRVLQNIDDGPARSLYAETLYPRIHLGWSELRSLIDDRHHFIRAPRSELYDVRRDPGEQVNLAESQRPAVARMRADLDAYGTAVQAPAHVDPEEAKKLAALGYLSAPAGAGGGPLPDPKDEIEQLAVMSRAAQRARDGDLAGAVSDYRAVVARNPKFTEAWNALGAALERKGELEAAAEAYRSALATTPELAGELGLRLGTVLMRMGKFDEAQRHAALAESANFAAAKLLEAKIAIARNDLAGAAAAAQAAGADRTTEPAAVVLLAWIAARQGRLQEAQSLVHAVDVIRAERNLGAVEQLELVRGDVLARDNLYNDAVAAFEREIQLFPSDMQAYAELALLHAAAGQRARANDALARLTKANPTAQARELAAKTARLIAH